MMSDKIVELAYMSDVDFYDCFIADAPLQEQAAFLMEFPDFMQGELSEYSKERLLQIRDEIVDVMACQNGCTT